jgi:hypothetical protein
MLAAASTLLNNTSMKTKDILVDIANRLTDDATLADAAYELELRAAIVDRIESLDRGEGMFLEDVENMLPKWISK